MKKLSLVLFCAACTVILSNSASAIKPDESDSQYLDAEHAYLSGDATGSLQKLSAYLSLDPASVHERMVAKAHNLRGLIFFQQKPLLTARCTLFAIIMRMPFIKAQRRKKPSIRFRP